MLGGHPGVDRDVGELFIQLFIGHLVQLCAGDGQVAFAPQMPILRAMARAVILWSPVIIMGLMPAIFASATAAADSSRGGSIMDNKPHKSEAVFILQGEFVGTFDLLAGKGQHPQAVFRHLLVLCLDGVPVLLSDRTAPGACEDVGGASKQHIQRPFGEHHGRAFQNVAGAHEFAVGVKWQFHPTGESVPAARRGRVPRFGSW